VSGEHAVARFFSPLSSLVGELWGSPAHVSQSVTVVGPVRYAGCSRPLPSSAARFGVGEAEVWLPCPLSPTDSAAEIFLHGGWTLVLPVIRLCVHAPDRPAETTVEYVPPGEWLADAVRRWRFPRVPQAGEDRGDSGTPATVAEALRSRGAAPEAGLRVLAKVVRYAIFGTDRAGRHAITEETGLVLPERAQWLRPAAEIPLGAAAARSLVITARLHDAPSHEYQRRQQEIADWRAWKEHNASTGSDPVRTFCEGHGLSISDFRAWLAAEWVPKTGLTAAGYRIVPTRECDRGLDPVHTPEGPDIRLTGRLGCGVEIRGRRLVPPDRDAVPLSVSTAQIPFAQYDDPRRLLMAANMQVHAVPVSGAEPPRVRTAADAQECRPPGVNLRVGYLAWRGLNHEDAWVISEPAARRLATRHEEMLAIAVRSVELPPQILVRPGDRVQRGQRLVTRRASPALLASSLEILASLPRFDAEASLVPAPDDLAPCDGTVVAVESWDLVRRTGVPAGWHVPDDLVSRYRHVVRIRIERELPLRVGDKLANRHGHKGIVGAILLEEDMPQWNGQPLEALLDPVSVLNRSNWGQVHETLAGAAPASPSPPVGARPPGSDEAGRSPVDPPRSGGWMTGSIWAVVGVQFVMRLPHHASERLAASPSPEPRRVRERPQRFGEMDHWALWAHGSTRILEEPAGAKAPALTAGAERLRRVLAMAGYDLRLRDGSIIVTLLGLGGEPPDGAQPIPLGELTRPEAYAAIDAIDPGRPAVLVFDQPIASVPLPKGRGGMPGSSVVQTVRWLPAVPLWPDRSTPRERADESHPLTEALRAVVRAAYYRRQGRRSGRREWTAEQLEDRLRYTVRDLMQTAYANAVGDRSTGEGSSKWSVLRRCVLGRRLRPSVRATAAPAGPIGLALDEVGLPPALARALLGVEGRRIADGELAGILQYHRFWIKRDPVLHRWGLLPVRARLVEGDVIRLPASLLGPMGADFDGDTIALFATLPRQPADIGRCRPSTLAWDETFRRAMFVPGKQYRYGLGRLMADATRLQDLQEALRGAGAPTWDGSLGTADALADWVRRASGPASEGWWWSVVEEHALAALAEDPGMGFGLLSAEELSVLPAVRWAAAKQDIFDKSQREAWQALERVLGGKSLAPYTIGEADLPDPIAEVMVAAKAGVGRFGGALRRLLYSAPILGPALVADAQALTQQATQRVLSVKAGKKPIPFAEYERQLRRLLRGEAVLPSEHEETQAFLEQARDVCERLRVALGGEGRAWLEWVRTPHELADCVARAGEEGLRLPLHDVRVGSWLW